MKFTILFFITLMILSSCGESEQGRMSRAEISATVRQTNTVFQDLIANQKTEESLNLLRVRDYYSEYNKQFREIRNDLAGKPIIEKYSEVSHGIDSLLLQCTIFMNSRQENMLSMFDLSNALSSYNENMETAIKYKYEPYGGNLFSEYMQKALEKALEFQLSQLKFMALSIQYNSYLTQIEHRSAYVNNMLIRHSFSDTLNFHTSIADTNEFFNSTAKSFREINGSLLIDRARKIIEEE